MLPFSFEWAWDWGHCVFHGGMWFAGSVIGLGMTYCIGKAALDTIKGKGSEGHH